MKRNIKFIVGLVVAAIVIVALVVVVVESKSGENKDVHVKSDEGSVVDEDKPAITVKKIKADGKSGIEGQEVPVKQERSIDELQTLPGKVVFKDTDEPVKDVKLILYGKDFLDSTYRKHIESSDTEGKFLFKDVAPGDYQLKTGNKDKYHMELNEEGNEIPLVIRIEKDQPFEKVIVEVEEPGFIGGTIFVGDYPLSFHGLSIELKHESIAIGREVTTDTEGRFIILQLPDASYDIHIRAITIIDDKYRIPIGSLPQPQIMKNVATGTDDLVFRCDPAGSISGIARDAATNEPVTGFEIRSFENGKKAWSKEARNIEWFEDGKFLVTYVKQGTYRLEIIAKGYTRRVIENIEVRGNETTDHIEILLFRGASITGKVVSSLTYAPVRNARIALREKYPDENKLKFVKQTNTDTEGNFAFDSLTPDANYVARIRHNDYLEKEISLVGPSKYHSIDLGFIALETGGIIEGRVTDHNRNPVENARISVHWPGVWPKISKTDDNGCYKVSGIPTGEVTVFSSKFSSVDKKTIELSRTVACEEGRVVTVDFEFAPGLTITGVATDNGKPLSDASVYMLGLGNQRENRSFNTAGSDGNGEFEFSNLSPGKYLLIIKKHDKSKLRHIPIKSFDGSKSSFGQDAIIYEHKQIVDIDERNTFLDIATKHTSVSGHVVNGQGDPVTRELVLFKPMDIDLDQNLLSVYFRLNYFYSPTEINGGFDMGRIPPGRYEIGIVSSLRDIEFQPITQIVVEKGVNVDNLQLIVP